MYFKLHICIVLRRVLFFRVNFRVFFSKVINVKGKLRENSGLSFVLIERLAIKSIKTALSAPRGKLSTHQGRGATVI